MKTCQLPSANVAVTASFCKFIACSKQDGFYNVSASVVYVIIRLVRKLRDTSLGFLK